jgi:Domain of unknown function, B. Theta Gene description (DUF3871)
MVHTESITPSIIERNTQQQESGKRKSSPFIEANTMPSSLDEMRNEHIIPVFVKDNETLISHVEFIESAQQVTNHIFRGETILPAEIRLSHPIKGRVPEAKDKQAAELYPWEKTIYYERMAFVIEIPSIQAEVDGNLLTLSLGGVKAYNEDNLFSRSSQSDQHFKLFIGFQNKVCTNLCVWTDGFSDNVKVRSAGMLRTAMLELMHRYNLDRQLDYLWNLPSYTITEEQFAQFVGKCRMYHHLPADVKKSIPPVLFGDQQLGSVVRDYYKDRSFCRDADGNINLWRFYNLITGVNKSSYIDSFLERSLNALQLTEDIRASLDGGKSWYLN